MNYIELLRAQVFRLQSIRDQQMRRFYYHREKKSAEADVIENRITGIDEEIDRLQRLIINYNENRTNY